MNNKLLKYYLSAEYKQGIDSSDLKKLKQVNGPKFDYFTNDENRKKVYSILESSFEGEIVTSIPYVENLIEEVEEVMEDKRQLVEWSAMDGIYNVIIGREITTCIDTGGAKLFQGELPTSEIFLLLKDWLEFLKEYYKRSFVPLEWIKEEYLEEARKLQNPING